MIFLPGIELGLEEFDTEFKFLIDDQLYFLYEENDTWQMRILNTKTLKLSTVNVLVEDEDEISLRDFDKIVVVHNGNAFIWNREELALFQGTQDPDGFQWNFVETTGDGPNIGISFGYSDESTSYYCVIEKGDVEGAEWLYRLNLETMAWQRQLLPQPEIADSISKSPLRDWHWDTFAVGTRVHFLPTISAAEDALQQLKVHLVLDLVSLELSQFPYADDPVEPAPIFYRNSIFIYNQHLWAFGISQSSGDRKCMIYRCDTAAQKWIEIGKLTDESEHIISLIREPTTVGSRVLFMTPCQINRMENFMRMAYALDLDPSLSDRAGVILAKNPRRVEQARRTLPAHIIEDLIERSIFPGQEETEIGKEEDEPKMEDHNKAGENEEEEEDEESYEETSPKRNRVE